MSTPAVARAPACPSGRRRRRRCSRSSCDRSGPAPDPRSARRARASAPAPARGSPPARVGQRSLQEALQDRDEERRGLAGAGLGAGDDVVAGQRERDDAALHRARLASSRDRGCRSAAARRAPGWSNGIGAGSNGDGSYGDAASARAAAWPVRRGRPAARRRRRGGRRGCRCAVMSACGVFNDGAGYRARKVMMPRTGS